MTCTADTIAATKRMSEISEEQERLACRLAGQVDSSTTAGLIPLTTEAGHLGEMFEMVLKTNACHQAAGTTH